MRTRSGQMRVCAVVIGIKTWYGMVADARGALQMHSLCGISSCPVIYLFVNGDGIMQLCTAMHCVMCVQRIGITGEASWSFCTAQNKASVQMRANPTRMSLLASDPRAALPIKLACVRSSRSSQPKLIIPQYFYMLLLHKSY